MPKIVDTPTGLVIIQDQKVCVASRERRKLVREERTRALRTLEKGRHLITTPVCRGGYTPARKVLVWQYVMVS